MPSLREVQRAVRTSLVEGDDRAASAWIVVDGIAAQMRLEVHRRAFAGNLAAALRLSFPAVRQLVGPEFFDDAARRFAHEAPPTEADLDAYGAGFPDFVARLQTAASLPWLPDVARLEWAVTCALHAPDAPPLDALSLVDLAAEDHPHVCFVAHPSVSLVSSPYPVDTLWRAVLNRDDAALADLDPDAGPVWLLVHRGAEGVTVTRLDVHAWRFSNDLLSGQPLGRIASEDVDASALLAEHLAAGRFAAFTLAEATGRNCDRRLGVGTDPQPRRLDGAGGQRDAVDAQARPGEAR